MCRRLLCVILVALVLALPSSVSATAHAKLPLPAQQPPPPPPPQAAAALPAGLDLLSWLHALVFHPGAFSFIVAPYNITLRNLTCANLTLGDLSSGYALNPPRYNITVPGLGLGCRANIELQQPNKSGSEPLFADLAFALAQTSAELAVAALPDTNGLIDRFVVSSCKFAVHVPLLTIAASSDKFLWDLVAAALEAFLPPALDALLPPLVTDLVQVNLTAVVRDLNRLILPFLHPPPPVPPPPVPADNVVDLREEGLLVVLDYFLDDLLGAHTLNTILDGLTNGTGALLLDRLHANATVPLGALGNLTFGLTQLNISGLNTAGALDLFEPTSPITLRSLSSLGLLAANLSFFLVVNANGPVLSAPPLLEVAEFDVLLTGNTLRASTQLALNATQLAALAAGELLQPGCVWTAVDDLNMTQFALNTTVGVLALRADGAAAEASLDKALDDLLAMLVGGYTAAIPAFLNGVVSEGVRGAYNTWAASRLAEAHTCTPPAPTPAPAWASTAHLGTVVSFAGAFVLALLITCCAGCIAARRRARRLAARGAPSSTVYYRPVSMQDGSDDDDDAAASGASDGGKSKGALVTCGQLSPVVRYGVVFFVLGNIAMFISSNTGDGATVELQVSYDNHTIVSSTMFIFSLGNSVHDMWLAGVYPLSLLIAVFSGGWPYAKLLCVLYVWLAGPSWLFYKSRESIVMFIDMMGKWSLIDAYVLVMMMIAFRLHMALPAEGHLEGHPTDLDILVIPDWGFYGFVLATMMSLCITHFVLAKLRRVETPPTLVEYELTAKPLSDAAEALRNHSFRVRGRSFRCTLFGQMLVVVMIVVCCALLIAGSWLDSFYFHFRGAIGVALEFVGDNPDTAYSVVSAGQQLPLSASGSPNAPGIRFIQATFYLFAMCVPLLHMLVLFVLWVFPLRPQAQRRWFVTAEVFNAWSALEVFVVSLIAALLEIHQFAQFIIGDSCDAINGLLTPFNRVLDGDDVCFDVVATLAEGCWTLFIACVISITFATLIMSTCHRALAERFGHRTGDGAIAFYFWSGLSLLAPGIVSTEYIA